MQHCFKCNSGSTNKWCFVNSFTSQYVNNLFQHEPGTGSHFGHMFEMISKNPGHVHLIVVWKIPLVNGFESIVYLEKYY